MNTKKGIFIPYKLKNQMRIIRIIFITTLFFCNVLQAQTVATLVVNGVGDTPLEAQHNALRSALEQSYGVYISSETKILNDILVEDKISAITNGKIIDFEVLNEIKISDNNFTITLKATVSVEKLVSYAQSKGASVEFKGGLFGANIKQKKLNKEAELVAISNLRRIVQDLSDHSFDYEIVVGNPLSINESQWKDYLNFENDPWKIPLEIKVIPNSNFLELTNLIKLTLSDLQLSKNELEDYKEHEIDYYVITLDGTQYYFRNIKSINSFQNMITYFYHSIFNFEVYDGVTTRNFSNIFFEDMPFTSQLNSNFFASLKSSAGWTFISPLQLKIVSYFKYSSYRHGFKRFEPHGGPNNPDPDNWINRRTNKLYSPHHITFFYMPFIRLNFYESYLKQTVFFKKNKNKNYKELISGYSAEMDGAHSWFIRELHKPLDTYDDLSLSQVFNEYLKMQSDIYDQVVNVLNKSNEDNVQDSFFKGFYPNPREGGVHARKKLPVNFILELEQLTDKEGNSHIIRFNDIRKIEDIEQITEYTIKRKEIKEDVKEKKSHYGVINDPDGYTNVREEKSSKSEILFKVYEGNKFRIIDKTDDNWWLIGYNGGQGFIYSKKVNVIE